MNKGSFTWTILFSLIVCVVSELTCPEVAELGSSALFTCTYSGSNIITYSLSGVSDAIAICTSTTCQSQAKGYDPTFLSGNSSTLEIMKVQLKDGEEWTCKDGSTQEQCTMVLTQTPSCTISSGNNNTELHIGEEVSLSVEIRNHYCSKPIDFLLKTGNTREELKKALKVDVTNRTDLFNSTFRVSESHNGSVQLLFVCNDITESVPCDGVKELIEVDPPLCNIASEGNKSVFYVSEKISITAEVDDYFCSRSIEYQLQAGQSSEMLTGNTDGSKNGSNVFTSIFTITQSHFGPVKIRFLCNNMSKMLYCGGIKNLTEGLTTTSTPLDYSGKDYGMWTSFIILFGVGTGVAGTLLLVGLCHLVVYLMRRKNTGCVSGNHYDGFKGRDNDAKTGYDEIGTTRSQESDTAEGVMLRLIYPGHVTISVQKFCSDRQPCNRRNRISSDSFINLLFSPAKLSTLYVLRRRSTFTAIHEENNVY